MEAIRQWAFSICCGAVAGGMAQMLAPNSPMQKVFRITLGAFFLCSLIYPFLTLAPQMLDDIEDFAGSEPEYISRDIAGQLDGVVLSEIEAALTAHTVKKLDEMGINNPSVTIYINTEAEGGVAPEDIVAEIELDKAYEPRHDQLIRDLEYQLGIDVKIGYR